MTYLCVECSKIFATKSNLTRHVKTAHLKQQNYICTHCDKAFGQNATLQRHISTVHNFNQNFKCKFCDKSFGQNENLQKHVNLIHVNPKPRSMSRLEQNVCKILSNCQIKFQREVTFNDLKGVNNGYLRFDFVIQTDNDSIPMLMIESDGTQHEKPVTFGGMTDDKAINNFEILQQHDQIKNLYCVENGYPLLRLKFVDYKYFDELIADFLKQYSLLIV